MSYDAAPAQLPFESSRKTLAKAPVVRLGAAQTVVAATLSEESLSDVVRKRWSTTKGFYPFIISSTGVVIADTVLIAFGMYGGPFLGQVILLCLSTGFFILGLVITWRWE